MRISDWSSDVCSSDLCLPLLAPGKAYVASLPVKDANEMVKAGRSKELVDAIWGARAYRPDAIVDINDIMDEACEEAEWGLPWPWVTFTKNTYGIRRAETGRAWCRDRVCQYV